VRQRSADDVETIYENIQRLKREREQALNGGEQSGIQPPCDTEQPRMEDYALGYNALAAKWHAMCAYYIAKNPDTYTRTPGEQTDGA
jgi:hypothetical protein